MPGLTKPGINIVILNLVFAEHCLYHPAIHNFSVWLRTSYNPADINNLKLNLKLETTSIHLQNIRKSYDSNFFQQ